MSGSNAPNEPARAQAAIRWPHPGRQLLGLIGAWVIGLVAAIALPSLFVSPGTRTAPAGRLWLAFSTTLLGAALMLLASFAMWRRNRDSSVLTLGIVPAVAVVSGGIILVVTKLYPVGGL